MRTPAVIRFDGPEPYIDPVEGTETPEWYVFAADALGDPTGKVYTVRDFYRARTLAGRMAIDRRPDPADRRQPRLTRGPRPRRLPGYSQAPRPDRLFPKRRQKGAQSPQGYPLFTKAGQNRPSSRAG